MTWRGPARLAVGALLVACGLAGCDGDIRLGADRAQAGGAAGQATAPCSPPCEGLRVCSQGACQCPQLTQVCGADCVDTTRDPRHCGKCGHRCEDNQVCVAGVCDCEPGFGICDLSEKKCVNLASDSRHCGSCTGPGCKKQEVCVAGSCVSDCPAGFSMCENEEHTECANLAHDRQNCGQCGERCGSDEVCAAGLCRRNLPAASCTSCPCPACATLFEEDAATCCPSPAGPLCVLGGACP